ncbi:MAG: HD domain-containing protein [Rhodothermales bacterium]
MNGRFKLFSDPVHGFISVPRGLVLELVGSPEVQRLRRIRQLGIGHMVFPGAEHSRFGHALGAMALMHNALTSLSEKGTQISQEEHEAALAVALLHDVGHGPYSHTLEHELLSDFQHEMMSRALLERLNTRMGGRLEMAIAMFDDTYSRRWFHQLISSQLDMDRLDYLRRDSYYTGVAEGAIGVGRIIKTLRVHPDDGSDQDRIVVEAKGTYAIENYLIARRLMYWQVYLHKTVIAGDQVLRSVIRRVRFWLQQGENRQVAGASEPFLYFLKKGFSGLDVHEAEVQDAFVALDDADILFSLKRWMSSPDAILADLSRRFLERDFFRVDYQVDSERLAPETLADAVATLLLDSGLSTPEHIDRDLSFYLLRAQSSHEAYDTREDVIAVLNRAGRIEELSVTEDVMVIEPLAEQQIRPYVCYPKEALSS